MLELPNAGIVGAFPKPAKAPAPAPLQLGPNPSPKKADPLVGAAPKQGAAGVLTPAAGVPGVWTPARVAGVDGVWALVVGAGDVKANPAVGALALALAPPAVKPNPPVAEAGVGVLVVARPAGALPNAGRNSSTETGSSRPQICRGRKDKAVRNFNHWWRADDDAQPSRGANLPALSRRFAWHQSCVARRRP